MQGPGRADEDTRDGFTAGGWAARNVDEKVTDMLNGRVAQGGGMRMLLGRFSYDDMLGFWNTQDSPFTSGLNSAEKYVVSRTLTPPLPWPNSTVLGSGRRLFSQPGASDGLRLLEARGTPKGVIVAHDESAIG